MKTQPLVIFLIILSLSCGNDSSTNSESEGYTVSGRIVDFDGEGVAGVNIELSGSNITKSVLTGVNGIYEFTNIDNGLYIITCSKEDVTFTPKTNQFSVDSGNVVIPNILVAGVSLSGLTFVSIPGGTFEMGSNFENDPENPDKGKGYYLFELPIHTVILDGFEMSITEISNMQYAAFLNEALVSGNIAATISSVIGKTGEYIGKEYIDIDNNFCEIVYDEGYFIAISGKEKYPAIEITWFGAKAFALHYGLDLPTEAEWEYAARGGKNYKYGTDNGTIDSLKANYDWIIGKPVEVGSYPANPFGFFNMSGNVYEWCNDWFGRYISDSATNPTGPPTDTMYGELKVARGGDMESPASQCRSAYRVKWENYYGNEYTGFRVVRRLSPQNQ